MSATTKTTAPDGAPWLLLRGLSREAAHWGDFPKRLCLALNGQEVICVDLPGAGLRHKEPVPLSVPEMAADFLRATVERLGGTVNIMGQSLGALVALEVARQRPNVIERLVLLNPAMGGVASLLRLTALTLEPSLYERELLIHELTSSLPVDHKRISQWELIQRERPVGRGALARQIMAASRYSPPHTALETPLLMLTSRGDRVGDPARSQLLARELAAVVEEHPSAGHDLALDAPDFVTDAVRRFCLRTV